MGNYISRINKDHFFVIEEFIKNEVLFSNGVKGLPLNGVLRKHIQEFIPQRSFKNVGSITNWDVVVKHFLNGLGVSLTT